MNIGPAGIALIQSYEKCRLASYKPTPNDVWTCGWGSTHGVTENTVWTQEEADAKFVNDLEWVQECLDTHIHVPITQHETDALASLCYNIGCEQFRKSTLVRMINDSDFDGASKHFMDWVKQNHITLPGLVARRQAERELFEGPA